MDTLRFTAKEREFVYGVAMKYMKDEEKAHDVTQDALLLAYRHRASFRGDSRFTTWLYRIAATTALMHLRKDRRVPQLQSIDAEEAADGDEPRGEAATPEEQWASSEAVQIAGDRLARLGDKYGQIFAMRFVEGYSESEIARKLSLNVATVKTRAYRARAHLKRELQQALAA
ncbi:MAG TPA: sigma-70 family RNA polymerase sigma factor [Polyangia bacterium]|jgi:RNA polymerase sigma-70 factor (ECF subfamily)|nr:sigma-70 family RNA polymerase sigma factor [Polyangia bacterium]HWE26622.1 sigma-70 family RNA polymerase sigma factor [Polyangia bacterium]